MRFGSGDITRVPLTLPKLRLGPFPLPQGEREKTRVAMRVHAIARLRRVAAPASIINVPGQERVRLRELCVDFRVLVLLSLAFGAAILPLTFRPFLA